MRDVLLQWTEEKNYTSRKDHYVDLRASHNDHMYCLDVMWTQEIEGTYAYYRLYRLIRTFSGELKQGMMRASSEMPVRDPDLEGMLWAEEQLLSPMDRLTYLLADK